MKREPPAPRGETLRHFHALSGFGHDLPEARFEELTAELDRLNAAHGPMRAAGAVPDDPWRFAVHLRAAARKDRA